MAETQKFPPLERPAVPSLERPVDHETAVDVHVETRPATPAAERSTSESAPTSVAPVVPVQPMQMVQPTADLPRQIENILSSGLAEAYAAMDPATQERFRRTGEETSQTIARMVNSAKVQTKKILQLIVNWLKIIPGVNRYFLEQEAKIKADEIIALSRRLPPA